MKLSSIQNRTTSNSIHSQVPISKVFRWISCLEKEGMQMTPKKRDLYVISMLSNCRLKTLVYRKLILRDLSDANFFQFYTNGWKFCYRVSGGVPVVVNRAPVLAVGSKLSGSVFIIPWISRVESSSCLFVGAMYFPGLFFYLLLC